MLKSLLRILSLRQDAEAFDAIHNAVEADIMFSGARIWVLISAIILASVGLNMNSSAVIIGAMLISPLMGPINGMGYSIATYDFPLLRKSFKNFSFAVISSLVASTLYFAITPVSSAHSELLARTSPTIYDVLVALFGGLAGAISLTTKLKGNVVPGVAIATALMPPLCTAGYGLATGHFTFFFGALYLFTINSVFIGLANVGFARVMRIPLRSSLPEEKRTGINRIITAVILVTLIPSVYFGYVLVKKEHFIETATRFVQTVSLFKGNFLLRYDIDGDSRTISMIYAGEPLTSDDKVELGRRAEKFGLEQVTLKFEQGLVISKDKEFQDKLSQMVETDRQKIEIARLNAALQANQRQQDSLRQVKYTGLKLLNELKPLFPQITSCLYAESYLFSDSTGKKPLHRSYVLLSAAKPISRVDRTKMENWLKARLQNDSLRVVFE
ncbi:MAG TPA: DUF389 domain-containing protein [Chlorobaculum sp.]|jgi:uncharacterized hydrophobic protein (TIGR00271 family)|uniref:Membrane protein, putative n=1 Tax=Chlorobaculum tepidum (strain ATCC 49652 / DSM 12025 / NBRC 103806 / TLS) TaxID=194439 RepID=Q8KF44_CHLTE|nr:DUF389 domain-containing protein [Chlorobaculum tepidum]AAM71730.1 membrane protein, putative [Chlorobaculum tepidum TLS]HBU23508.1 DUF389 domain-containing protein [Chlorobaculum sp.]